jgi:hypothetical protein
MAAGTMLLTIATNDGFARLGMGPPTLVWRCVRGGIIWRTRMSARHCAGWIRPGAGRHTYAHRMRQVLAVAAERLHLPLDAGLSVCRF